MRKVADLADGAVLVEISVAQLGLIERLDRLVGAVDAAVQEWLVGAAVPPAEVAGIKPEFAEKSRAAAVEAG